MTNRIWGIKQLWLQVNGHAWFHLHGICWPVRNGEGANKALYDQSYLGYKTTMTSGEWSCLISFTWNLLTCSERRGSEQFKMKKKNVSRGIRTQATPFHDRKVSALDRSATLVRYQVEYLQSNSILKYEYKWTCDKTCMESVMVWYSMQSSVNNYYTS